MLFDVVLLIYFLITDGCDMLLGKIYCMSVNLI